MPLLPTHTSKIGTAGYKYLRFERALVDRHVRVIIVLAEFPECQSPAVCLWAEDVCSRLLYLFCIYMCLQGLKCLLAVLLQFQLFHYKRKFTRKFTRKNTHGDGTSPCRM